MHRFVAPALALSLTLLATACTGPTDGTGPTGPTSEAPVTTAISVPTDWVEQTTAGWPDSRAFGSSGAADLAEEPCLLTDEVVIDGATFTSYVSGWGPFRADPDDDVFVYTCEYGEPEGLRARLQLLALDATRAADFVELVLDQETTEDREFEPATLRAGDRDVHVYRSWYGPGEEGQARALVHDPDAGALMSLEVAGLDADAYASYDAQDVADDLAAALSDA